ncbi:MAG: signal peptidase II [Bacteroidetes bacterium]|nr:signal peptidase II [Bacteroidota bacterium]
MLSNRIYRVIVILLIIVMNIGCDQVSKKIVRERVAENETVELLKNHFILTRVENSGAFLSLGDSLSKPGKNILLSALPMIALIFAAIYVFTKHDLSSLSLLSICFIIGGGIGNIFDRMVHGSVTDFFYIHYGIFQTGVFNMADLSITTGAIMILLQSVLKRKNLQETN